MTPAAVSMKCLTARPDRGATLAYVSGGMAIARSVGTTAFPLAGTTVSAELQAHADHLDAARQQRPAALIDIP